MPGTVLTLLSGLTCLVGCVGLGAALLRLCRVACSGHWWCALALLSGVATIQATLTGLLFAGASVQAGAAAGAILLGAGLVYAGILARRYRFRPGRLSAVAFFPIVALALNLCIAVAPSTKIDELHYHMLAPKRIVEDGRLRAYREPFEAAIYPQMAYQYAQAPLHLAGVPDAGNVVSWGLSAALVLMLVGAASKLTNSVALGWTTAGIAAAGLYTAVFHVTGGPHALGDLAITVACCLLLLPRRARPPLSPMQRLLLTSTAACLAATTKLSLLPLACALTGAAVWQAGATIRWRHAIAAGLFPPLLLYAPSLLWSWTQTGSPFGLATAKLFSSTFFDLMTVASLGESRRMNQAGLFSSLWHCLRSTSVAFLLAPVVVAFAASVSRRAGVVLTLFVAQWCLIAVALPHDFRFLGGLQFVCLVFAVWQLNHAPCNCLRLYRIAAALLCAPWLCLQVYYAVPFLAYDAGWISPRQWLTRYVGFHEDFEALDRLLPRDAVLFVESQRTALFYAPRRVATVLRDIPEGKPVYRWTGSRKSFFPLSCREVVYRNPRALEFAFRTPGRPPIRQPLTVERCVESFAQTSLRDSSERNYTSSLSH